MIRLINRMRNILLFLLLLGFAGCGDFLEESSKDEVRPSTVDDLMQVMVGEGYPMGMLDYPYTDLLSDDVQCNGAGTDETMVSRVEEIRSLFLWEDDMFEILKADGYNSWKKCYNKIMGCNTILDYIDKVTGEQTAKDNLRGQAYVLRAYYYFLLVNYYALPYNFGNPAENLGVPLKLEIAVHDGFMARNSVAEVYEQIVKDLEKGIQLLEENPVEMSLYKIHALAGKSILCRVYLYMEDLDNTLKYANMVLEEKSTLTSLASMPTDAMQYQGNSVWSIYNSSTSDEIIWMYGGSGMFSSLYPSAYSAMNPFTPSDELMDLYDFSATDANNHGDLRVYAYYYWNMYLNWSPFEYVAFPEYGYKGGRSLSYAAHGIRTAELYLNRAEVYVRKFMETGEGNFRTLALADLNKLRENRYDTRTTAYEEVDIKDADELWQFYQEERRRELSFEGHRWFDLRRYGMPELSHVYFVKTGEAETITTLREGDPRYVLPIPQVALDRNPYLEQNKR